MVGERGEGCTDRELSCSKNTSPSNPSSSTNSKQNR
uniref:Uncharacterized protein n=1 Tax=Arundo donax TaxID=35708 RepID=A0A0A9BMU3_ARUDO